MAAKRGRTANFSIEEANILVAAVENHPKVYCKKTDATTSKAKAAEWDVIAKEVNAVTLTTRTGDQYRLKYDCLKREARRRIAQDRLNCFKTGGGQKPKSLVPEGSLYDRIRIMNPVTMEGLPSVFDSDAPDDTALDRPTATATATAAEDEDADFPVKDCFFDGNIPIIIMGEDDIENVDDDLAGLGEVLEGGTAEIGPSSQTDWSNYTPSMLRQKKSKALKPNRHQDWVSRRRPVLPAKQQAASTANMSKFANLADSKAQLAQLQVDFLQREEEDRRTLFTDTMKKQDELHEINMKIQQALLEEACLNVAIKKAQLTKIQNF